MNEQEQIGKEFEYFIQLLILGDLSVGKSSFIYRFIYDKFNPEEMQESKLDSKTSDIKIDKKNIRVQLWDTVGQEKYKAISRNLILKMQGIILLFDITNKDSYNNIKTWIDLIKEVGGKKLPILIVGNKIDLEEERLIKKEEAKAHFKKEKIKYVETSCKEGTNIKKAIARICKLIIETQNSSKDISFSLNSSTASYNKKRHCCH